MKISAKKTRALKSAIQGNIAKERAELIYDEPAIGSEKVDAFTNRFRSLEDRIWNEVVEVLRLECS